MPKGMGSRSMSMAPSKGGSSKRLSFDSPSGGGRRRGSDAGSDGGGRKSGRKSLSRTMTAIGMAGNEDKVSKKVPDFGAKKPEPEPEPVSAEADADASGGAKPAPKAVKKRSDTIQVGIRCRPLIGRDAGQARAFDTAKRSLQANDTAPIKEGKAAKDKLPWVFDNVFDEASTVHDIHSQMTDEVVESVMEGYHGTIFAYGQTGSGKTYTMVGDRKESVPGVMTLGTEQMFKWIEDDTYRDYMVRVSYMEIYNERVRDLLNPSAVGEELKVREDKGGRGFYVECQEVVVQNEDQIYAMLDAGNELRTVGATDMNAQSSRTHAIFRLVVESVVKKDVEQVGTAEDNAFRQSYLNLVDLAGSERTKDTGASGIRLKEAGNINLSLSCLANIIRALSEKKKKKKVHLPFRDSKLTQILQPSLGGNSRTAFICTVTLAARFFEETKSTLAFADRAKKVTNSPKKNIVMDQKAMLTEAQDEIEQLKQALAMASDGKFDPSVLGGGGGGESEAAKKQREEMEQKMKFLESMVIGQGGAQSLETMNAMWTPEMGSAALDGSAAKMLQEAEAKRVEEWRSEQKEEIGTVWKKIDVDGSGALDPEELNQMFTEMGQPDIDVDAALAEIDEDGDGEVDFDEFFEWWCTRSVADRDRLKGKPPTVAPDRLEKLKILLRIGAGMAGSIKRNEAVNRTVGFAQIAQAMSIGGSAGPNAGGAAMSASAQKKFSELRIERDKLAREAEVRDAALADAELATQNAQDEVQRQQEELEATRTELQGQIQKKSSELKASVALATKREGQLATVEADYAMSKAEVAELKLRLEQVQTKAGLDRARAAEDGAELKAALDDRDRTISTLAIKCQRMEAEVAELQGAVVDLAVDERVRESERARAEMESKKRQTDEQVQKLRMEVASAKYMQTLYWENRKFAEAAGAMPDQLPPAELEELAAAAAAAAAESPAQSPAQSPKRTPERDAADEMRRLLGLEEWERGTAVAGAMRYSATSSPRSVGSRTPGRFPAEGVPPADGSAA